MGRLELSGFAIFLEMSDVLRERDSDCHEGLALGDLADFLVADAVRLRVQRFEVRGNLHPVRKLAVGARLEAKGEVTLC